MVKYSKPGQTEGNTIYQTGLSCHPSVGVWSDSLKEAECHEVAKNISK